MSRASSELHAVGSAIASNSVCHSRLLVLPTMPALWRRCSVLSAPLGPVGRTSAVVTLERVPSATACSGSGRLGIARLPSRAVVRLRKRHIALVPRLPLIPSALGATPPAEPLTAAAVAAAAEALGLAVGAMAWAPPVRAHAPMATRAAMVPPPLRVVLARADATSAAQGRDMALALDRAFARARLRFFLLVFRLSRGWRRCWGGLR